MSRQMRISTVFFATVFFVSLVHAGGKRFDAMLRHAGSADRLTCWVFFTDKGTTPLSKLSRPSSLVSERSLQRRLRALPAGKLVDETDLPVEHSYVEQVSALVTKIRQETKWLNGVSVEATPEQLERVSRLPFVKEIEPVARFWNRRSEIDSSSLRRSSPLAKPSQTGSLDYGPSFDQLDMLNVPAVHATGNSAQGIIIGVFDNGVRLLQHECFDSLRSRVVATHDFVDNKTDVRPDNPSAGFGGHGVITLSAIGGFRPGQLIGPAYGASFILARTENDSSGSNADFYPSEEDNWIAAAEWAESLGVQVTSTSLGYFEHLDRTTGLVDPETSWKWSDLDGKTIPISRAAALAAQKGVIVVNSAGNEADQPGREGLPNTLNAPADADGILAVGAVNGNGAIAGFSSYGPTADGRIKPDVVAMGVFVRCANWVDSTAYTTANGTSLSCPLVAGAAALVLKACPNSKPVDIIRALKATANNAASPDNHYGWGIIDAYAAINYLNHPAPTQKSQYMVIRGNSVHYSLPEPAAVTIKIYSILGQEVRTLLDNVQSAANSAVVWDATSSHGNQVACGVYIMRMEASGASGANYTDVGKTIVLH